MICHKNKICTMDLEKQILDKQDLIETDYVTDEPISQTVAITDKQFDSNI